MAGLRPATPNPIGQLRETRLVATADIRFERARRFADEYNADAYENYHDLLARPDVDAVSICVPSGLHAQVAIDALQAGKHVLVEKPIALSLADADRMIAVAREQGRLLGVVLQNRLNSPMQQVRQAVDEGLLGRLYLGNACVRWFRPQSYYEDGWHGTWAMDGGALMNQSIHHIDALQWLMGPVQSVQAYSATLAHQMEAEDVGVAVLRFASGALGTVEGSTADLAAEPGRIGDHLRRARLGAGGRHCAQPHHPVEGARPVGAGGRDPDQPAGRSALGLRLQPPRGDPRLRPGRPRWPRARHPRRGSAQVAGAGAGDLRGGGDGAGSDGW